MTILLDTTRHRFVFTYYTGHIPYAGHLTRHRVGEYNLVGNLLYAMLLSLHMDGHLLVIVADGAAHRGDALSLQS